MPALICEKVGGLTLNEFRFNSNWKTAIEIDVPERTRSVSSNQTERMVCNLMEHLERFQQVDCMQLHEEQGNEGAK